MHWLLPALGFGGAYLAHKKGVLTRVPVVGKPVDKLMSKLPGGNKYPEGWSSEDVALYNQMMTAGEFAVGMCGDAADLAAATAAMQQDLGAQGYGGGYGYCPYGGYGGYGYGNAYGLPSSPYGYCPTYGAQPMPSPYGYGSPYYGAQPVSPYGGVPGYSPYGASPYGAPQGYCPSINPKTGQPWLTSCSPGVSNRANSAAARAAQAHQQQALAAQHARQQRYSTGAGGDPYQWIDQCGVVHNPGVLPPASQG